MGMSQRDKRERLMDMFRSRPMGLQPQFVDKRSNKPEDERFANGNATRMDKVIMNARARAGNRDAISAMAPLKAAAEKRRLEREQKKKKAMAKRLARRRSMAPEMREPSPDPNDRPR